MAIITLEQYQTLTGDTTHDTQISALIPYVQADFVNMCNYDFNQDTDDEEWPDGCELYVAKMLTWQLNEMGSDGTIKKSENIDGYSYTLDGLGEYFYPVALEKSIKNNYARVSSKRGSIRVHFPHQDKRGFSPRRLT
jgi:hypothetical protein